MSPHRNGDQLRLALPKGHMQKSVLQLIADAGIRLDGSERDYRPRISLANTNVKLLKPQNIVEMLQVGSRDIGFAGRDWVVELELDEELEELLDTGLDPVRLVAAAPISLLQDGKLPRQKFVVASEYERISRDWIAAQGLDATLVRSFGATEVFPPEDADIIVDNTATGSTLRQNQLAIVDELLLSSTRLYANRDARDNPMLRGRIDDLVLLLRSVLDARQRVMLELNCPQDKIEEVIALLPAMRRPTVAPLYGEDGFAVKAAVPRAMLPELIPQLRAHGGTDIVVTALDHLVT
ncbi:MAG: ATP phosphoribosyltransferase [Candidatus Lernaella stagnicola]|nr:ATP phosphoribosyltransferase [Candidatus Lernaella stagnicola]